MGTVGKVVVGVGAEDMRAVVELAAEEARRTGSGLHLVRAVHVLAASPEAAAMVMDVKAWNRDLLEAAVAQAEDVGQGVPPVTHELVMGTPVSVLVAAGRKARMVVLAHRHLSRVSRLVDRSVANAVAAHLPVPVLTVPVGRRTGGAGVVVVGVDVPERAEEVLRAAIAEARARDASLRVVHSGDGRRRAEVSAALDRLGDESVALEAEVVVRSGRPADVLLEESRTADLLVLGRHDPLVPIGSHLGPVARAVLRESACPVLLASPHHARRPEQLSASGRGGF